MTTAVRSPAVFKRPMGLLPLILLLCIAPTAEAAPPWNVAYREVDLQDALTGDLFPVALRYPTLAVPAPLFVTGSLSLCRFPAVLCRRIAFEMPVAHNAPVAAGAFGLIVVSHGAGGMALLHRDLAMALASQGYVVAAPTHPRGKGNDISGVGVWVGRPKQVSRVIDAVVKFCSYGGAATREAAREVGHMPELRDPRVRSIVLMAPNVAPFTDDALVKITVPVLVYAAEKDDLTRVRYHGERLAKAVPQAECVLVKGAGHFSFVASFPTALKIVAGEGARDPDGFDRDALHEVMNREIVGFFNRTLRPGGGTRTKGARPPSCRSQVEEDRLKR